MTVSYFFDKLPLEILQEIGIHIVSDKDIISYARTCRATHNAIDEDNSSFWRRRFLRTFDKPDWTSAETRVEQNMKYREHYGVRKFILLSVVQFSSGRTPVEKRCLEMLKSMLMQSLDTHAGSTASSKNLCFLKQFTESTNVAFPFAPVERRLQLHDGKFFYDAEPSKLLFLVQCLLAPSVLNRETYGSSYSIETSQKAAYSEHEEGSCFKSYSPAEVNLKLVVHNLNFWRHYFRGDLSGPVRPTFDQLPKTQRPQYWKDGIGTKDNLLGRWWKGTYAFLEHSELVQLREMLSSFMLQDKFPGEDDGQVFQDLELKIVNEADHYWPESFEQHHDTSAHDEIPIRTRAQRKAMQVDGTSDLAPLCIAGKGFDQDEAFQASGWLSPLPDQMGVSGWHRMTLMKYYVDSATGVVDDASLWAYEGVMLPGAQIIVGRWWRADPHPDFFYSGPFILWCLNS